MPFAVPPVDTTRKPLSCERVKVNWEHPLNQGLVAWWLFNEQNTKSPALSITDGRPALLNGPTWSGRDGSSLYFDGNDYLLCDQNPNDFDFTSGGYTIVARVAEAVYSGDQTIFSRITAANGYAGLEYISKSGVQPGIYNGSNWFYDPAFTMVDARFYTWISAANGTTIEWWANGKYDGSTNASLPSNSNLNLYIGARGGTVNFWTGWISFLALYNRCLSVGEIQQWFSCPYGTPTNPRLI